MADDTTEIHDVILTLVGEKIMQASQESAALHRRALDATDKALAVNYEQQSKCMFRVAREFQELRDEITAVIEHTEGA
jgi:acyl-CoA reductase-like NAD-dependent aldehyde dehydrogenase